MKAFSMLSMALFITSCLAVDEGSPKKDKDGIWELTLKLGDDLDDPQAAEAPPTTKEVVTEKVPNPVEVEKRVEVKVPYPVEVIKKVPVVVEKRIAVIVERKVPVHVDRPVPYPVRVVQKQYVKVPYPVYVKKPVYIEKQNHESYGKNYYKYQLPRRWGIC